MGEIPVSEYRRELKVIMGAIRMMIFKNERGPVIKTKRRVKSLTS